MQYSVKFNKLISSIIVPILILIKLAISNTEDVEEKKVVEEPKIVEELTEKRTENTKYFLKEE